MRPDCVLKPSSHHLPIPILPLLPTLSNNNHILRLPPHKIRQIININHNPGPHTTHNTHTNQPIHPIVGARTSFETQVAEELDVVLGDAVGWRLMRVLGDRVGVFGAWTGSVEAVRTDEDVVVVGGADCVAGVEGHGLVG